MIQDRTHAPTPPVSLFQVSSCAPVSNEPKWRPEFFVASFVMTVRTRCKHVRIFKHSELKRLGYPNPPARGLLLIPEGGDRRYCRRSITAYSANAKMRPLVSRQIRILRDLDARGLVVQPAAFRFPRQASMHNYCAARKASALVAARRRSRSARTLLTIVM